ncbi:MAG: hypothetical protein R2707_05365 [Acidimicrobiales bacterium]
MTATTAATLATAATAVAGRSAGADAGDIMALDLSGQTVNILTPETASEADGFLASLQPLVDATGVEINFNSTRDATTELNLEAGAIRPTSWSSRSPAAPRCSAKTATRSVCQQASTALADEYDANWFEIAPPRRHRSRPAHQGRREGPRLVQHRGLRERRLRDPRDLGRLRCPHRPDDRRRHRPAVCVAMESQATGWVYTDWMENVVLRQAGPDVYDQWVAHEIPFNGLEITAAAELIDDIWFRDGAVRRHRPDLDHQLPSVMRRSCW